MWTLIDFCFEQAVVYQLILLFIIVPKIVVVVDDDDDTGVGDTVQHMNTILDMSHPRSSSSTKFLYFP